MTVVRYAWSKHMHEGRGQNRKAVLRCAWCKHRAREEGRVTLHATSSQKCVQEIPLLEVDYARMQFYLLLYTAKT